MPDRHTPLRRPAGASGTHLAGRAGDRRPSPPRVDPPRSAGACLAIPCPTSVPNDPGTSGDRFPDDRPSGDRLPEATVSRLPVYLRVLTGMAERGVVTVSSDQLATGAGVNSAKLRKDLSHLGSYGIRGVGYDVEYLIYQVSRALGLTQDWPVVIVGAGNLGRALANYGGFATRGFRIAALLDSDPAIVGTRIGRLAVRHSDDSRTSWRSTRSRSASSPRRRAPPRASATVSSRPVSPASSTSRRWFSMWQTESTCVRLTCR